MALIFWAEVNAATDYTMAAVVEASGSRTRQRIVDLITPVAAGIIAGNATIIQAAEAALETALGEWFMANDYTNTFVIKDTDQRIALKVYADGSVRIPKLIGTGGGSGDGSGVAVDRVVLAVGLGQSNMVEPGRPTSPRLDPPHSQIKMWDFGAQQIVPATVPLSVQVPGSHRGLSPITQIARRFAAQSPGTHVVIVNTAVGGTGLVNESYQGVWKVGYNGQYLHLNDLARAAASAAIARARTMYDREPEIWFYWHQGETDSNSSQSAYEAALSDLIDSQRANVSDTTGPFTIGGMSPENVLAISGRENIRRAHVRMQKLKTYVAYADGVPNGGGSDDPADATHYTRQGVIALGDAMFEASMRAATASATQVPHKPLRVDAALASSTLTVTWSAPDTRYTSFVVEYRINGGAWVSRTVDPPELTTTFPSVSGGPVEVRVKSFNESTASEFTIPVVAH